MKRAARALPAGPSFCPRCGAPLRLAEEPTPRALDEPVALDRRAPREPTPGGAGRAAHPPPPPVPPSTRRSELADVERSHWELGRALGAGTSPPAGAARPQAASGPETWSGKGRGGAVPVPPSVPAARGPAPPAPREPPPRPDPAIRGPDPSAAPPPAAGSEAPAAAAIEDSIPDAEIGSLEVRVHRAEGWRRAAAWAVDGLPFMVAGGATIRWLLREAAAFPASPLGLDGLLDLLARERAITLSVAAAATLALLVYATLAHGLGGATLGKRLLGIRVVGPDGGRPSLGRSSVRSVLALASAGLLGLGFLLALFTRSGRSLHDFLARTWVIRDP